MKNLMKRGVSLALVGTILLSPVVSFAQGTRLSGSNRYGTNAAVVESLASQAKMAIVTSGKNFPDALSAYNLSKKHQAPIVMMDSAKDATCNMLSKLGIQEVIIVGGPASVSKDLERCLKKDYQVSRIYGDNRYETSQKTYEATKDYFGASTPVVQTTGQHFQEPLIATSYASIHDRALLLNPQMNRYALSTGDQGTIQGASIGDFNQKVMAKTGSSKVVMAQVASFPDSLSSVNYASLRSYKVNLVSSVKASDQYDLIVGGPATLKLEENPQSKPVEKPTDPATPYDPQGQVQLANSDFNEAKFNQAFLKLVNEERTRLRLRPVVIGDLYAKGVRLRVQDEATASDQDHNRPNGAGFWEAVEPEVKAQGMRNNWIGEILAVEFHSNDPVSLAQEAFTSWKNSPGHYAIMTEKRASHMYIAKDTISKGEWAGYDVVIAILGQPVKR